MKIPYKWSHEFERTVATGLLHRGGFTDEIVYQSSERRAGKLAPPPPKKKKDFPGSTTRWVKGYVLKSSVNTKPVFRL
jgi:hypothetical protein